jgi:iron complex transport system substrate-binding protein
MSLNEPPAASPAPAAKPATVSATLFVVAVLITAGVAVAATAAYYELRPAPASTAPGVSANRTTVIDDTGREVSAPVNATRIVVLAPSVMDFVYRLGLRDRVVGIGCTTSITGGIQNEYTPNQTALWNLSSSMCITDYPSLDTSAVALLQPQLVLASTITSATDVATLSTTYHLPVVILTPSTLEGIVGDVRIMVQLFPGTATAGLALEASLEASLANATAFDNGLQLNDTSVPSVLLTYGFYTGTYYVYGPGSFGQSLIDLAGGSSITAGLPLLYGGVNASSVLLDQPQVILYGTSWNDQYIVGGQTPSVWSTAPYWSQLNGTKIAIDVTLVTEPDPTMILALPWFLHDLYPTLYPTPSSAPP